MEQVTMNDISELLASIGLPGEKPDEKKQAVIDLFESKGLSGENMQGHHVAEDLSSYPEY